MIQLAKEISIKVLGVTSMAFINNGNIPKRYTCDGLNINPPLDISSIPLDAVSLAIIMEDPDAPINTWIHWLVWNIPVTHSLQENASRGVNGLNDFCKHFYCGPCPMSGTHHYVFKVYALDCLLNLHANTKKRELEKEMSEHILAYGELIGFYGRKNHL